MSDPTPTDRRDVLSEDDHARGCQGREYVCTCGYDDRLAAHVRRVERELVALRKVVALELGWDRNARDQRGGEALISIAAVRAMLDAMEQYVPKAKREEARDAALAAGIGYGEPARDPSTKA